MSERYFVDKPISGARALLDGPEAHHLIHVMRTAAGTHVVLFDGSGGEFPAVVKRVERNEVELAVLSREEIDRELPFEVTLAVSLPRWDRQRWLVEKAVELGVARIVPLRTQRAVAQPADRALVRLRRVVVEASKQCGRNRLLQFDEPEYWRIFVHNTEGLPYRILAHPQTGGVPFSLPISGDTPDRVLLAVGPEGGFTDEEAAMAIAAGWQVVDLGPRILRVETAAMMLAAIVAQWASR